MKKVENKKSPIAEDVKDYADLITVCANFPPPPPQIGIDGIEMEKRLRVIRKANKGGKIIELEDDDFDTLKKCVKDMRWKFPHEDINGFIKYIKEFDNKQKDK